MYISNPLNKISDECKFINGKIARWIERDKFSQIIFLYFWSEERQVGLRFENFPQPWSRHRLQSRWISRGSRIETRKIEIRAAPLAGYVKLEGSKAHRIEFLAGIPFYAGIAASQTIRFGSRRFILPSPRTNNFPRSPKTYREIKYHILSLTYVSSQKRNLSRVLRERVIFLTEIIFFPTLSLLSMHHRLVSSV